MAQTLLAYLTVTAAAGWLAWSWLASPSLKRRLGGRPAAAQGPAASKGCGDGGCGCGD